LDIADTSLSNTFFLPGTLLVLLTGVVLGMGTKWGLTRFYWVLTKLAIALVLLAVANLADPDTGVFGLLTILTSLATVLSILKPWGRVTWRRSPVLQETS
jgi:hypothetical protein